MDFEKKYLDNKYSGKAFKSISDIFKYIYTLVTIGVKIFLNKFPKLLPNSTTTNASLNSK